MRATQFTLGVGSQIIYKISLFSNLHLFFFLFFWFFLHARLKNYHRQGRYWCVCSDNVHDGCIGSRWMLPVDAPELLKAILYYEFLQWFHFAQVRFGGICDLLLPYLKCCCLLSWLIFFLIISVLMHLVLISQVLSHNINNIK